MKLRVLSLGAGVQSSTLALMIEHGDIPMVDCAIFADTMAEPKEVMDHLSCANMHNDVAIVSPVAVLEVIKSCMISAKKSQHLLISSLSMSSSVVRRLIRHTSHHTHQVTNIV